MYVSHYVFYKVKYPSPGVPWIYDIELEVFQTPSEEHAKTQKMRKQGYKTLRLTESVFDLMLAVRTTKTI